MGGGDTPQFPAGLTGQDTKVSTQRTHLGPQLNCTLNPSNNPRSSSESATLGTPPRPVNQLHCPAFAPLCLRGKKNFKAADSRNLFQRKARKQAAGSIHPVGIISTNAPAFTPALKSLECCARADFPQAAGTSRPSSLYFESFNGLRTLQPGRTNSAKSLADARQSLTTTRSLTKFAPSKRKWANPAFGIALKSPNKLLAN